MKFFVVAAFIAASALAEVNIDVKFVER